MIDEKLYRETFSRLRASDEAKKEVFRKMENKKTLRLPKLLRGAAIAAVMAMALAVSAGAANVATGGTLLDGMLFRIISFDKSHMELVDEEGNNLSVTVTGGELVREEDGRVYVCLEDGETDVTDTLLSEGSYTFEYETQAAVEGPEGEISTVSRVMTVEITGVPGDLIVTQKDPEDGESVVYSVREGTIVGGAEDVESFTSITESIAEDGTVYTVETESAASHAAAAD